MKHNPWTFIQSCSTLQIASISKENLPSISYAPFIQNEQRFYICLSSMAKHTHNIQHQPKISIMMIEDESTSTNLFARKRVTFDVITTAIQRDSLIFNGAMTLFKDKFGTNASIYESLADFQLFELDPQSGRAVFGFGEAYDFQDGDFHSRAVGM